MKRNPFQKDTRTNATNRNSTERPERGQLISETRWHGSLAEAEAEARMIQAQARATTYEVLAFMVAGGFAAGAFLLILRILTN